MAEISRFLGISIGFCNDLSSQAHVHVSYNNHHAVIAADTFGVLSGKLPPRVALLVMEWVMLNKDAIKRNWETHKLGLGDFIPIPPLAE